MSTGRRTPSRGVSSDGSGRSSGMRPPATHTPGGSLDPLGAHARGRAFPRNCHADTPRAAYRMGRVGDMICRSIKRRPKWRMNTVRYSCSSSRRGWDVIFEAASAEREQFFRPDFSSVEAYERSIVRLRERFRQMLGRPLTELNNPDPLAGAQHTATDGSSARHRRGHTLSRSGATCRAPRRSWGRRPAGGAHGPCGKG